MTTINYVYFFNLYSILFIKLILIFSNLVIEYIYSHLIIERYHSFEINFKILK